MDGSSLSVVFVVVSDDDDDDDVNVDVGAAVKGRHGINTSGAAVGSSSRFLFPLWSLALSTPYTPA